MENKVMQKIASYSDEYVKENLNGYDKNILLTNWQEGLGFLFDHSFYQGRSDKISWEVEKRVKCVLEKYIHENNDNPEIILNSNKFPEIRTKLMEIIGKNKMGRGRDIEMVISILKFISKNREKNIVNYSLSRIQNREIVEHFSELQKIYSIGPKCSSFYLRDLISVYSLDKLVEEEELVYLQPIDTWIRQIAYEIGIINNPEEQDTHIRESIIEACKNSKISTIKFNQGAWYLGSHSFKLLIKKLEEE